MKEKKETARHVDGGSLPVGGKPLELDGMPPEVDENILKMVRELEVNKKYSALSYDTIAGVVSLELSKHNSPKNARKAIRKKLHLILADYLSELNFPRAELTLKEAFQSENPDNIDNACLAVLQRHASTRERIRDMEDFYASIFKVTGSPKRVADLACAFNPFSLRWMNLPADTRYDVYDNNKKTVGLLNYYFQLAGCNASAVLRDILCDPLGSADPSVDVAFLFKMYHCLEHRQKGAGWQVVKHTDAKWLAVSFPSCNLAGRKADIWGNYRDFLLEKLKENQWEHRILESPSELILLIKK
ncbi:MAG: hypothetical protein GY765_27295 [bacterium]|nr:hypothetical protein [bacterium]